MRIIVAMCAVQYRGRVNTLASRSIRMICIKGDNTVSVHDDSLYKALNWMPGGKHTEVYVEPKRIKVIRKQERLDIILFEILHDYEVSMQQPPKLLKEGSEQQMQILLAKHPSVLEPGLMLIGREYPTPIGPIDLMCIDPNGQWVIVEVKRAVGHIGGVTQLLRYMQTVEIESGQSCRGFYVAPSFAPNTLYYAQRNHIQCIKISLPQLRNIDRNADPLVTKTEIVSAYAWQPHDTPDFQPPLFPYMG